MHIEKNQAANHYADEYGYSPEGETRNGTESNPNENRTTNNARPRNTPRPAQDSFTSSAPPANPLAGNGDGSLRRAGTPRTSTPVSQPSPAAPEDDSFIDAIIAAIVSGAGSVYAEIVRLVNMSEESLKSVAEELKAVNDGQSTLRAIEQQLRNITSDGKIELGELTRLEEHISKHTPFYNELKPQLEELIKAAQAAPNQTLEYKPYSTDQNLQDQAKKLDALKEAISGLKDSYNAAQSELNISLQLAMSRSNQVQQLQSNIMASFDRTGNAIIGNMRA